MESGKGEKVQEKVHFNGEESSEKDGDDNDFLKREIASHALYGFLVQSHFDCLKLCLVNNVDGNVLHPFTVSNGLNFLQPGQNPELDQFMEAYCVALNKLKGAIEEPQQETMAFINNMYSQLEELLEVPSSTVSTANSSSIIKD